MKQLLPLLTKPKPVRRDAGCHPVLDEGCTEEEQPVDILLVVSECNGHGFFAQVR